MISDPWISHHTPIEPERFHALGVMTFRWNAAEYGLFWLFCTVSGFNGRTARVMVHDLQMPSICDKIKALLEIRTFPEDVRDAVTHAITLFDANRVNRNQLTHFLPTNTREGLQFWRNKGPKLESDVIPSSLADIRRVADEIHIMDFYQNEVANHLSALFYGNQPQPLPEKPPIPERLWKPPNPQQTQGRKKRKPPPQSSEE